MSLSEEIKNAIIDDLKEDRLDYEEIAAKRLGDPKKKYVISRVAKKNDLSRKNRRRNGCRSKVAPKKAAPVKPIKIATFDQQTRLALIDEAITIHKTLLSGCTDPYKMDKWSAALERLLEQRREEEPKESGREEELLAKFTDTLENHAISTQTSGRVSGLPQDPANPDVRVGEKRKD